MEVVVEDKQLSLAIGKKGQNVRLAAKLVGWRIDIKSEEEKRQEVEAEMARMARIVEELRSLEAHGVPSKIIQKLIDAGVAGPRPHPRDDRRGAAADRGHRRPRPRRRSARRRPRPRSSGTARDAEEAARLEAEQAARRSACAAEQAAAEDGRLAEEQLAAEQAAAETDRGRAPAERTADDGRGRRGGAATAARWSERRRGAGWGTLGSSSSRGI